MNASRDWLTPIGNTGIFVTPNEPVDPFDCARWPGSPFCSDPVEVNPQIIFSPVTGLTIDPESLAPDVFGISTADIVTITPISIAVPIWDSNECETCITFGGTFWFVPIPDYSVCRRSGRCDDPPREPPPLPPPPGSPGFFPANFNTNPACFYYPYIRVPSYLIGEAAITRWDINQKGWIHGSATGIEMTIESEQEVYEYGPAGSPTRPIEEFFDRYGAPLRPYRLQNRAFYLRWVDFFGTEHSRYVFGLQSPVVVASNGFFEILDIPNPEIAALEPVPPNEVEVIARGLPDDYPLLIEQCFGPPARVLPPPPPPEERCRCMCCNNQDNESEELLRLIAKRIGVTSFPVEVPQSLLDGSRSQQLQSMAELSVWQSLQMDGLVGQFPIKIKIKDTNLAQSGDQGKTVTLFNIAESLAELYALSAKTSTVGDAQTEMLARLAAEAVATHAGVAVSQDYVQAIASYLGFASSTPTRKLKFAFDLAEPDSLDKLMKTVEKELVGFQDDDKNTVQDYLEKLMFAAGIIKTVYYKKGSQVPEVLRQMQSIFQAGGGPEAEQSWNAFLELINGPAGPQADRAQSPRVRDRTNRGEV